MVAVWIERETRKDGCMLRRVFVRVTGETLSPLDVIPAHVPEPTKGVVRTGQRVRVNRAGTWAVWRCVDVPKNYKRGQS